MNPVERNAGPSVLERHCTFNHRVNAIAVADYLGPSGMTYEGTKESR